ncbi:VOC family protein [Agrococcus sp. ARC_14]|uniref:VOC family protein n=1 Tax=Agrococcus sp. ARC_14 TaxID=2919927 RepID=UPI001F050734|nr:VOC family protein [Agrococcus sp. ARC_14]MCH1881518.1 VOC family protein [Agrococcus sp. ARC_14]
MPIPPGFSTINPFIVTDGAAQLIVFLTGVFDGVEHPDARTIDQDGLLLQAELQIGGTTVQLAERKPDWPFTPSLLQVYVDDVAATLERAASAGATVVTTPTEFFGSQLARFLDPAGNLWWLFSIPSDDAGSWGEGDAADGDADWADGQGDEQWEVTPELGYIHDTLVSALAGLRDPRQAGAA